MIETAENYLERKRTLKEEPSERSWLDRLAEGQDRIRTVAVYKGASVGFSTGFLYSSVLDEYWREFKQASEDLEKSFRDLNFNKVFKKVPKQPWQKGYDQKIPKAEIPSGGLSENTKSELRKKRKKRKR